MATRLRVVRAEWELRRTSDMSRRRTGLCVSSRPISASCRARSCSIRGAAVPCRFWRASLRCRLKALRSRPNRSVDGKPDAGQDQEQQHPGEGRLGASVLQKDEDAGEQRIACEEPAEGRGPSHPVHPLPSGSGHGATLRHSAAKTTRLDPARRLLSAFIPGAGATSCLRFPEAIDGLSSINSCGWSQGDDGLPSVIPGFQPFSKPRRSARETWASRTGRAACSERTPSGYGMNNPPKAWVPSQPILMTIAMASMHRIPVIQPDVRHLRLRSGLRVLSTQSAGRDG